MSEKQSGAVKRSTAIATPSELWISARMASFSNGLPVGLQGMDSAMAWLSLASTASNCCRASFAKFVTVHEASTGNL